MTYLLDANVFIQAKNLHYGFDFCPAFWDWVAQRNAAKSVFSIEKVGDELVAGDDELVRKIKVPNVCVELTIRCVSPFEMLRRERARFVLGAE